MQLYLMATPSKHLYAKRFYCLGYNNEQRSILKADLSQIEDDLYVFRKGLIVLDCPIQMIQLDLQIIGPIDDTNTIQQQYPELFI